MGIPIRGLKRNFQIELEVFHPRLKNGNPDQGIETLPFHKFQAHVCTLEEWESRSGD